MKSKITKFATVAVIIIVTMIGINQFGGSVDMAGVAWADVVANFESDIKSSNTLHMLLKFYDEAVVKPQASAEDRENKVESLEPQSLTSRSGELWLRKDPFICKIVWQDGQSEYFTEGRHVCLDHQSKTFSEQTWSLEKAKTSQGFFEALVTGNLVSCLKRPGFNISEEKIIGQETLSGEKTTIYEFVLSPSEKRQEEGKREVYIKWWIEGLGNRTIQIQSHSEVPDQHRVSHKNYELIKYGVYIPVEELTVKIPAEYTEQNRRFSVESEEKGTIEDQKQKADITAIVKRAKYAGIPFRIGNGDVTFIAYNRVNGNVRSSWTGLHGELEAEGFTVISESNQRATFTPSEAGFAHPIILTAESSQWAEVEVINHRLLEVFVKQQDEDVLVIIMNSPSPLAPLLESIWQNMLNERKKHTVLIFSGQADTESLKQIALKTTKSK